MFLPPHRYLERLREYESLKRRYDQEVLGPQQFLEEEEQEAKVDTMEIECTAETVPGYTRSTGPQHDRMCTLTAAVCVLWHADPRRDAPSLPLGRADRF